MNISLVITCWGLNQRRLNSDEWLKTMADVRNCLKWNEFAKRFKNIFYLGSHKLNLWNCFRFQCLISQTKILHKFVILYSSLISTILFIPAL